MIELPSARQQWALRGEGSRPRRSRLNAALTHATLIVLAGIFLFPLFYLVSRSLMTRPETIAVPPAIWPSDPQWVNYPNAWNSGPFGQFLLNTITITALTVLGGTASAALCGYGFARLRFPGKDVLFVFVLATLMLPQTVVYIPLYIIFRDLGWLNSILPLVVPPFFGGGAISIFLFRQHFRGLPRELDEAAKLDGASTWHMFWHIAMPLSKPVTVAVGTLLFLASWTDLFAPMIFLNEKSTWTLAQGITSVFQTYQSFQGKVSVEIQHVAVVSLVLIVPPLVLYALFQRHLMEGIVPSGSGDRG